MSGNGDPVAMRSTSSVAAGNAGGAGLNAIVTTLLVFFLGRAHGGRDNIPADLWEIVPYLVIIIGGVCHFAADLLQRWRHVVGVTGTGHGGVTGTGDGEAKG